MEYNDDGAFQMNFYVKGEKVAVHIDDRIPYVDNGPNFLFGGLPDRYYMFNTRFSQDGAWWLVLLEKAFAKLNVNYSNLNDGYACDALNTLTGAPCVRNSNLTDEKLWELVGHG